MGDFPAGHVSSKRVAFCESLKLSWPSMGYIMVETLMGYIANDLVFGVCLKMRDTGNDNLKRENDDKP